MSGTRNLQKIDPAAAVNKVSFQVMEGVDKAFVGPIAHVYRDKLPKPARQGLHNFFFNLTEPVNAINHMLQLHPGRALKVVARFGINSTIGVAGLIDMAARKPFNLPYRANGFANTMGYYGIGPGPYLFLPLVGPTTVRDLIGTLLGQATLPTLVGSPFNNRYYVTAAGAIISLDYRVEIDDDLNTVRQTSSPYASYRQLYLKTRHDEIEALHGRGPLANGQTGVAPFARPLHPDPVPAPPPLPAAPPPVIDPQPVVQPLPSPAS